MSFEEVPALEKCEKLAVELLVIKRRRKLFIIGCRNFRQPFILSRYLLGSKTPPQNSAEAKKLGGD